MINKNCNEQNSCFVWKCCIKCFHIRLFRLTTVKFTFWITSQIETLWDDTARNEFCVEDLLRFHSNLSLHQTCVHVYKCPPVTFNFKLKTFTEMGLKPAEVLSSYQHCRVRCTLDTQRSLFRHTVYLYLVGRTIKLEVQINSARKDGGWHKAHTSTIAEQTVTNYSGSKRKKWLQ